MNPVRAGFHPLHSPSTIRTNGPFRSITSHFLTSSSSDLFLVLTLFHFYEAFHNFDTPLPFECTGASYTWLCSCFASCLPSALLVVSTTSCISGEFQALSFTLLSSSSNRSVSIRYRRRGQEGIRITWKIFLNYSCPPLRSWVFLHPIPCGGEEAGGSMLPLPECLVILTK